MPDPDVQRMLAEAATTIDKLGDDDRPATRNRAIRQLYEVVRLIADKAGLGALVLVGVLIGSLPTWAPVEAQVERDLAPFTTQAMTVSTTALAFTAGTLVSAGRYAQRCEGVVEAGAVRYYTSATPTAVAGVLVPVNNTLVINGRASLAGFKAIRSGATDGVIFWQCYR